MPTHHRSSALRTVFWILAGACCGMAALLAYLPAAGHDQLWILYVADRVLSGTPLYGPQLMESNPPLIVWLSLLPTALARLTHLPPAAESKLLVVALQAAIAALSLRQLRRLTPDLTRTHLAALAVAFIAIFNVVPARDLGQRDHLLALLCLPYILAAALRVGRPPVATPPFPEATLIGLLAGLGLALKPHNALVPIAVEVFILLRTRSIRRLLRPEPFAILAVAAAYIAAVLRLTPGYTRTILPLLRDTYWAAGSLSLPQLIAESLQLHILAVLALAAFLRTRRTPNHPVPWTLPAVPWFLIAGAASTLAYYLQGTGWYYQQLPAMTFFAFALTFTLLPFLERIPTPVWLPRAAAALSILALALTTHFMGYPFNPDRSFAIDTPDPAFFRDLPPGTPVATLTPTVDYTVMPAARWHLTIAQRYPHLWLLPAILRNETPAAGDPPPSRHTFTPSRLAELSATQHRFMREDFTRWQPTLVLIERCQDPSTPCQLLSTRHDNLLAWFLRDPDFASLWHNYSFKETRGRFDAYVRSPTLAATGPVSTTSVATQEPH